MRLAVMQPYLFPYLGYFQLVNAVDQFVFFDDVNFINKGWINRNQLLQQNEAYLFSLPLMKASQNRMINEIEIADYSKWRNLFLKQIEMNYRKAPFFTKTFAWLDDFLFAKNYNLIGELASDSVKAVSALLGIKTSFYYSSQLNYKNENTTNGQGKILHICEMMGTDTYINPKNGEGLYNAEYFRDKNVEIKFIFMDEIKYPQFLPDKFVPYLSILDLLMFNNSNKAEALLNKYALK